MDHLHDANLLERALVDKANQSRVPITTNFELTPTCTLNCDMCFIRTERSVVERHGGLSPLQQWLDWAEQLQDMGTLFILLTGGEPMLYPHFKELYTRLREMGFILTLNTNGTLIDNEMVRILQTPQAAADKRHPVWRQQRNLRTLVPQSARIHPVHGSPETVEKGRH